MFLCIFIFITTRVFFASFFIFFHSFFYAYAGIGECECAQVCLSPMPWTFVDHIHCCAVHRAVMRFVRSFSNFSLEEKKKNVGFFFGSRHIRPMCNVLTLYFIHFVRIVYEMCSFCWSNTNKTVTNSPTLKQINRDA